MAISLLFLILLSHSNGLAMESMPKAEINSSKITVSVPGGPGFISVNSYALQPYYPNEQYTRLGQLLYCQQQSTCQFATGINLPHGATITKFVAYYYDNSDNDLHAALMRGPLEAEFPIIMADIYSAGKGVTNRYSETTTIVNPVIDNQVDSYFLIIEFSGTDSLIHFIGVRVDYAYPSQLPLVLK